MQRRLLLLTSCLLLSPLSAAQDIFPRTEQLWEGVTSPSAVAVGDFDGDGINDVVAVNSGSATHVLRGLGGGNFDRPRPTPRVGSLTRALLVADQNADGRPDIYVQSTMSSETKVTLLRNRGNFEFEPIPVALLSTGLSVTWWESADTNGDGLEDLILSVEPSFTGGTLGTGLIVWRASGAAFEPVPLTVQTGRTSRFRAENLVGDGLPDLLFRSLPGGQWQVAENLGAGGFGAPTLPFSTTLDTLPLVDLADLDGDGDLDVYGIDEPGSQQVFVAESFGGLNLGPAMAVALPFEPREIRFRPRDLTGDGMDDLFLFEQGTLNPRVYVVESVGGLAFAAARPLESTPSALGFGDLTGDGIPELLGDSGARLSYAERSSGSGAEFFGPLQEFTLEMGRVQGLITADLDGDTDADILFLGEFVGLQWLRNDGALRFARPELIEGPGTTRTLLRMEDMNGDGADDLIVRSEPNGGLAVRLRQGALDFAPPVTISSLNQLTLQEIIPTNFDSDGDTDLIQHQGGGIVELYSLRNSGNGTSFSRTLIIRSTDGIRLVAVLDADGDGFDDLVTFAGSDVNLRLGLGDGSFGTDTLLESSLQSRAWAGIGDFDLDGDLDVLVDRFGDGQLMWAENLANGTLGSFQGTGLFLGLHAGGAEILDINHDGVVDVVINRPTGQANQDIVLLGLPGGAFEPGQPVGEAIGSWADTSFEDLDGDGDLDGLSFAQTGIGVHKNTVFDSAGVAPLICEFGEINSAGLRGQLAAYGNPSATSSDLYLQAIRLPQDQFGIFAGSLTLTEPTAVAGSLGSICLAGSIGRYDAPSQIQSSGASGSFSIPLDPTALETSTGQVPAVVGETWFFQAWHRDLTPGGAASSNFTGALLIRFTP